MENKNKTRLLLTLALAGGSAALLFALAGPAPFVAETAPARGSDRPPMAEAPARIVSFEHTIATLESWFTSLPTSEEWQRLLLIRALGPRTPQTERERKHDDPHGLLALFGQDPHLARDAILVESRVLPINEITRVELATNVPTRDLAWQLELGGLLAQREQLRDPQLPRRVTRGLKIIESRRSDRLTTAELYLAQAVFRCSALLDDSALWTRAARLYQRLSTESCTACDGKTTLESVEREGARLEAQLSYLFVAKLRAQAEETSQNVSSIGRMSRELQAARRQILQEVAQLELHVHSTGFNFDRNDPTHWLAAVATLRALRLATNMKLNQG